MEQKYVYVPAVANVRWNVPELCGLEPGAWSSKVTVWTVSPIAQVQVTVAPLATLRLTGEKKLLPTVTPLLPPLVGPVGVSHPPPPQPARATIAKARSTDFLRMATSDLPSHSILPERLSVTRSRRAVLQASSGFVRAEPPTHLETYRRNPGSDMVERAVSVEGFSLREGRHAAGTSLAWHRHAGPTLCFVYAGA